MGGECETKVTILSCDETLVLSRMRTLQYCCYFWMAAKAQEWGVECLNGSEATGVGGVDKSCAFQDQLTICIDPSLRSNHRLQQGWCKGR